MSDYSHSGRHSNSQHHDRNSPERRRLAIVRRLFQQLIILLEYVQLCGISLGEFQPECFMVSFDSEKGGLTMPSLRLSHFGQLHSEHPTHEVSCLQTLLWIPPGIVFSQTFPGSSILAFCPRVMWSIDAEWHTVKCAILSTLIWFEIFRHARQESQRL
jgi:hypothetical protein